MAPSRFVLLLAGGLAAPASATFGTETRTAFEIAPREVDGWPDEWEIANGLDPRNPADGVAVNPDGYTNLERYLHALTLNKSTP